MEPTPSSPCAAAAASAPAPSSNAPEQRGTARQRRSTRLLAVAVGLIWVLLAACGAATDTAEPADGSLDSTDSSGTAGGNVVEANGTLVRVVDGDTAVIRIESTDEKVRFVGINTPESVDPRRPVECFGKEASKHLKDLLPEGTRVRVERDVEARDKYGRLLGYIYRANDGLFINLSQVADGYAKAYTFPPNVAHVDDFRDAEATARQQGAGLWSACPADG